MKKSDNFFCERVGVLVMDWNLSGSWGGDNAPAFQNLNRRFQPDINAHDDYAVLEHVRQQPNLEEFEEQLVMVWWDRNGNTLPINYEIGDYATAALAAIQALAEGGKARKVNLG